jgi:hypothetical protein
MRIIGKIIGTLMITALLIISGSANAGWYYITRVEYELNCTSSSDAIGRPDGNHATVGTNPSTLGEIILDLGTGTSMQGGQEFTVYASSSFKETYKLRLLSDPSEIASSWWTGCDDTTDEDFTAPSPPQNEIWRYFEIHSEEGNISEETDPDYGSEIDAIGFEVE